MKVTSIDILASNLNNILNLSFRDPKSVKPYIAKDIVGLDADEITPKFYGSNFSNELYYDLTLKKRNIVIKIGLNPDFSLNQTYTYLRDELYKFISSSRTGAIQLKFKNGENVVAAISGFVIKFESPNFTKTPEVQLTINCNEGMLRSVEETNIDVSNLDPVATTIIDNESTAPHGFRFGMMFWDTVVDFSIQDVIPANWAFEINLEGSPLNEFVPADEIHFSSEINNRYFYLIRGIDIIHLVDRILPTSTWPILFPGVNDFICSSGATWDYITHYPTYWGV